MKEVSPALQGSSCHADSTFQVNTSACICRAAAQYAQRCASPLMPHLELAREALGHERHHTGQEVLLGQAAAAMVC